MHSSWLVCLDVGSLEYWRGGGDPPEVRWNIPVRNVKGVTLQGSPSCLPGTLGPSSERSWGIMCTGGMADIHDRVKGDPSLLRVTGCMLAH